MTLSIWQWSFFVSLSFYCSKLEDTFWLLKRIKYLNPRPEEMKHSCYDEGAGTVAASNTDTMHDVAMSAVTQIVGGFTYEHGHLRYDVL